MDEVAHDGRRTAYRQTGGHDRGGLLYVHGSGATHQTWAPQYGPEGPPGPAAALDLSGHGDSGDVGTEPGPDTLAAYAEDVVAVARASDASVLVGHSLGGAVVLRVALDRDLDLDALVLAGTGARLAVAEPLRRHLDEEFESAVAFLHEPGRLFHDADDRLLERSRTQLRTTGRRVTRRDFLTCHAFDVRDRLDEIAVPTLAICGERDGLTPPSYHEYLAENVRDGRLAVIDDAAHLAMLERPAAFAEHVERFLADVRS